MKIEEYIRRHRDGFENGEMPEGHKSRFAQKLEAQGIACGRAGGRGSLAERFFGGIACGRVSAGYAVTAVCALAAIITVYSFYIRDDIRLVSSEECQNSIALEQSYLEQLRKYSETIVRNSGAHKEYVEDLLDSIIEDAATMAEQLPPELTKKEKYRILKEHYKRKAEALKIAKNAIADNFDADWE